MNAEELLDLAVNVGMAWGVFFILLGLRWLFVKSQERQYEKDRQWWNDAGYYLYNGVVYPKGRYTPTGEDTFTDENRFERWHGGKK